MTATSARPETPATSARPETAVRETFTATVRRLSAAQKGAQGAPAYSRFVNRRLGRALAFHAGLTPNAVTALSAACTATGIALLALHAPSVASGVLVAVLLLTGYALDSADGQLARLRGGGSAAGEWLDHMVDAVKISSLHLALLVGLYRFQPWGRTAWLLVPLGFSVLAVVHFFATLLNDALRAQHGGRPRSTAAGERPSVARSLLVAPTDYGVLCLAFLLLGVPHAFLAVYAALFAATALYLAPACVTWFREMEGLRG